MGRLRFTSDLKVGGLSPQRLVAPLIDKWRHKPYFVYKFWGRVSSIFGPGGAFKGRLPLIRGAGDLLYR